MTAYEKAKKIAELIDNKKGRKITALEVGDLTSVCDYYIICSGGVATQVKAIADEVIDKMALCGEKANHIEGYSSASWILLDFADVAVHIFTEQTREFYSLERLWADAKQVKLISDNIQGGEII